MIDTNDYDTNEGIRNELYENYFCDEEYQWHKITGFPAKVHRKNCKTQNELVYMVNIALKDIGYEDNYLNDIFSKDTSLANGIYLQHNKYK